jgi:hypothetical protein
VAAHGAYHREQALLSGIQLADGWVGFEQLDRRVVEGALLYFGSCESGSTREGPGAELDGWMAAGLGAGARELVLTLWKLDDEAAEAFAAEFYPLWTAWRCERGSPTPSRGPPSWPWDDRHNRLQSMALHAKGCGVSKLSRLDRMK